MHEKELQTIKTKSQIDTFYFEFLIPAIPEKIILNSSVNDIVLMLQNLVHLVGKTLVHERSILDNKLAYRNLSLTSNKKTKRKKQHK